MFYFIYKQTQHWCGGELRPLPEIKEWSSWEPPPSWTTSAIGVSGARWSAGSQIPRRYHLNHDTGSIRQSALCQASGRAQSPSLLSVLCRLSAEQRADRRVERLSPRASEGKVELPKRTRIFDLSNLFYFHPTIQIQWFSHRVRVRVIYTQRVFLQCGCAGVS